MAQSLHGILLLDKPLEMSSTRALERLKKHFGCKKGGHTGALDPLATGLLPLCFGDATKFAQYLLAADKTYETTLQLGVTTTTGDAEGEVLEQKPVNITMADVHAALNAHTGQIAQIPPMHSALKHKGQPLYALARQGIEIARAARPVTIYALSCLGLEGTTLHLKAHVSKGTYIRSLAEDIGAHLGCGAHVSALRRTQLGPFEAHQMRTLDAWQAQSPESIQAQLTPMDAFMPAWPQRQLDKATLLRFGQGQRLRFTPSNPGWWRFYSRRGDFVGIGELDVAGCLAKRRVVSTFPDILGQNRF